MSGSTSLKSRPRRARGSRRRSSIHAPPTDAAAGTRDLVIGGAGEPKLELVRPVAAVDDVGVAVDQTRRDPAAVAVDGLGRLEAWRVGFGAGMAFNPVLLAAMAKAGTSRLVLASSMVVYGEGAYSCTAHGVAATPPPRRAFRDCPRPTTCGQPSARRRRPRSSPPHPKRSVTG